MTFRVQYRFALPIVAVITAGAAYLAWDSAAEKSGKSPRGLAPAVPSATPVVSIDSATPLPAGVLALAELYKTFRTAEGGLDFNAWEEMRRLARQNPELLLQGFKSGRFDESFRKYLARALAEESDRGDLMLDALRSTENYWCLWSLVKGLGRLQYADAFADIERILHLPQDEPNFLAGDAMGALWRIDKSKAARLSLLILQSGTATARLRELSAKELGAKGDLEDVRQVLNAWRSACTAYTEGRGSSLDADFLLDAVCTARAEVLIALGQEFFTDESNPTLRNRFVMALSDADSQFSVPFLSKFLAGPYADDLKLQAAIALGHVGNEDSARAIQTALNSDLPESIRAAAIMYGLGRLPVEAVDATEAWDMFQRERLEDARTAWRWFLSTRQGAKLDAAKIAVLREQAARRSRQGGESRTLELEVLCALALLEKDPTARLLELARDFAADLDLLAVVRECLAARPWSKEIFSVLAPPGSWSAYALGYVARSAPAEYLPEVRQEIRSMLLDSDRTRGVLSEASSGSVHFKAFVLGLASDLADPEMRQLAEMWLRPSKK